MEPELSDLVITPFFGILRVVDISIGNETVLCIDKNGVLYGVPIIYTLSIKLMVDDCEYDKLQRWFYFHQLV